MVDRTSIFIIIFSHKKTKPQLRCGNNIKERFFDKLMLLPRTRKHLLKSSWQIVSGTAVYIWHFFNVPEDDYNEKKTSL